MGIQYTGQAAGNETRPQAELINSWQVAIWNSRRLAILEFQKPLAFLDRFGVFWGYHYLRKHPYLMEFKLQQWPSWKPFFFFGTSHCSQWLQESGATGGTFGATFLVKYHSHTKEQTQKEEGNSTLIEMLDRICAGQI